MKIIRNGLLGIISGLSLFACQENPLLLNDEIFSLEAKRPSAIEKKSGTELEGDKSLQDQETKNARGISIFESRPTQPYRNKNELESLSIAKSVKNEADKKTKKHLKSNAQQLNTNGSIPAITATSTSQQPQVVNETGIIQNADEIVQLDYEQVEIRQILEELADALGMSIVIDPSISGKITMRTSPNQPLKNKDLWEVLNMLLNESGISLEKKAGLYYAKRSPLSLPATVGYPSLLKDSNVSVALQITPLKNISADAALTVLKPILGPKSKISQIAQLNMLAIIGSQEQLSRINGLLQLVDADPFKHRGIRLYKIKQAEAKTIADELEEILKLIEGDKAAYQVLGLERINALLVVAPPRRGFKPVDRWVKILDEGADEGLQEQIFIYHCKSIECESLAATLNSIFENSNNKKNNVKKDTKTTKSNVFRTVPKDSLNIKSKNKTSKTTSTKNKTTTSKNKKNNNDKNSADIDVTIVSDSDTNTLIVRTTGKDYRSLLETIKLLDQTPLQVLVNVVIAQVSLSKTQSLGLDWKYQTGSTLIQNNLGKASSVGSDGSPLGLIVSSTSGNFSASLNALAKNGDINILSRPSLLIANNKEGAINIGKEVPVQTSETNNLNSSDSDTTQVTQEISYRNTGIELTVTPHINEDGIVNLEITQSLSAIEGSTSSQDASFKPTFTNQEITTTVVVGDGETIILGGLIDSVTTYKDSGIPFLMDIPVAGYLFKTQEESEDRRELMLIITPRIIGPETDLNLFGKKFSERFRSVGKYMDKELSISYENDIMEKNK
ncbi:MAG: type II secretion system secretin GspD [Pseudomonadota bacterium]